MSRWSSERSRLNGTGSSGTGSSMAGSALMQRKVRAGAPPFCSLGPRPEAETSCAGDKKQLEARLGVVEVEQLAQLAEPVAHGLGVDVDRPRHLGDAAVVQ